MTSTVQKYNTNQPDRTPPITHWVPYDAVAYGRHHRRALCGQVVHERRAHSNTPSCEACQVELAHAERNLDAEKKER